MAPPRAVPPLSPRILASRIGAAILSCALLAAPAAFAAEGPAAAVPPDHAERMRAGLDTFDKEVRGILSEHCLKCHGGEKKKGDFDLALRESLLRGGADGVSVVPFHPDQSRLLKMLRHEEEPYMPEKKPRLPDAVIDRIATWISQGAPYSAPLVAGKKPERDRSQVSEDDRQWWSFQPLAKAEPPAGPQSHAIDRFLLAKAKAAKAPLELAPQADRRTLIRRATLDLTGLPPTPEEVEKFVADSAPDAWPRLIDDLLSRPAYGERWARHWMDVARYGESSGFEQDYDRTGSYHYRDFLIQAFNADMPFHDFVRWQVAGDEFEPGNPRALAATAFLTLGVFPTQITVNELERVRYEDMDDMLSTTGAAFLGLTVGCARCHDHKFDPIPTRDYYRMLSTFTGTVRSEIELDLYPEETARQKAAWKAGMDQILAEKSAAEEALHKSLARFLEKDLATFPAPQAWSVWTPSQPKSSGGAKLTAQPDGSFLASAAPQAPADSYTFSGPVPLGPVSGLRLEALPDPSLPKNGPGRGSKGQFQLTRITAKLRDAEGKSVDVPLVKAVADAKDNSSVESALTGKPGWKVEASAGRANTAVFTFGEPVPARPGTTLEVTLEFAGGAKEAVGRARLSLMVGGDPSLTAATVDARVLEMLQARRQPASTQEREALEHWWFARDAGWQKTEAKRLASVKAEPTGLLKVLVGSESYPAVKYHTAGGAVETYKETYVLKRGNVALKGEVAEPGFLQVLSRAPENRWAWKPPEGAKYAGRRRQLAQWILDDKDGAGALAARVFVNRLWQHHFGQGIVPTPNDFGRTGTLPTQPELLDWLAAELLKNGGSVKAMHRLLMTSAAYQQAAVKDQSKLAADPNNGLFLRRAPARLEAEAVRDSMLAVAGLLEPKLYGPPVQDEKSSRRSVYLRIKRSQLPATMVSFDQPEPLASQGQRPTTTVAPQALVLMNSAMARTCAQSLAKRIAQTPDAAEAVEEPLRRAYAVTLGRPPDAEELSAGIEFLRAARSRHSASGTAADSAALVEFCQVLLSLNEFAYLP